MKAGASPVVSAIRGMVRRSGRGLLDVLLPPLCLRCREPVSEPQSVCGGCWNGIRFLAPPWCVQCGIPFPHGLGEGVRCAACLAKPRVFKLLRSAIAYDDGSRDLILGFKHADKLETCPLLVRWMHVVMRDAVQDADLIVPVPLHWKRLLMRKYNQAGLLATGLGRLSGVPVAPRVLVRRRATESQGAMGSARARLRNVASVFEAPVPWRPALSGRHILLVDDVLTTGATVTACAKSLLRGGAASVSIVTLARVVRPLNF